MDIRRTILLRTRIAFFVVVLVAASIVSKLIYLQFFQGGQWRQSATSTGLAYRPIPATRGNIYAADGNLLATSLPLYQVAFDPCIVEENTFQKNIEALSTHLADFYGDSSAAYYQQLIVEARHASRKYVLLNKQRINHHAKQQMKQWPIFCLGRWQGGVIFEKVEKRQRPFGPLAARTIGFMNADGCGAGLEYSFHQTLRGVDGRGLYQKMMGGHWKMIYSNATVTQPVHGHDLVTTLDVNLQDVAHRSLLHALQISAAAHGCVVVMEVKTGAIKAMVNLSRTQDGQYSERYNYAVGNLGMIEPGSTFKLASMLALLEETAMELTDTVDAGDGQYRFYDRIMKDVQRGGHGVITLQEVFEKSSNIGISRLVDETFAKAPHKLISYFKKLGFDTPLGLPLTGEGTPVLPTPQSASWSGVTIPWMAIGYNLKVTPMHILTLYNAIANEGKMVRPMIVKEVKKANQTLRDFQGKTSGPRICSDKTRKKLHTLLTGMVARGPARKFKHGFYQIAGKTGTANKVVDGRYTNDTCISFAGYFPVEAPRYSCIVVVDTPQNYAYHFGAAVAPVVKDIADKIAAKDLASQCFVQAMDNVPQDAGKLPLVRAGDQQELLDLCKVLQVPCSLEPASSTWVTAVQEEGQLTWHAHAHEPPNKVPHVVGMVLRDALSVLEHHGLRVTVQGNRGKRVKYQSILPGTKAVTGGQIVLTMG